MVKIAPGIAVRIVVETDGREGTALVLESKVYEADGSRLVLAQTEPPMDASACSGEVTVTYLVQGENRTERFGFPASVVACLPDYRLAAGGTAQALVVMQKGKAVPFSARTYLRVTPTAPSPLTLYVDGVLVRIADISLGGVKFSYDRTLRLMAKESVKLRFDVAGKDYIVGATILRTSHEMGRFRLAVASFTYTTPSFDRALVRVTRFIELSARRTEQE
jgi:hypothetical protein